jgi:uncharacterized membrane protein YozB (DUF420 family)
MTNQQKWVLAAIVVPVEVALAVLAWRDLDRRTDDQVRSKKRVWRLLVLMNPGNSIIYWMFGRR